MKKFLIIPFIVTFLVITINTIGVRQLQEFNDAKKEVEKTIRSSSQSKEPLSEELSKKLEKNLALIASIDKKAADTYRAQLPTKKSEINVEQPVEQPAKKPDINIEKFPAKKVDINVEQPVESTPRKDESAFNQSPPESPRSPLPLLEEPEIIEIPFKSQSASPAESPRKSLKTITPVFNSQSPLETVIPVRNSPPEERQPFEGSTQSFDVPVSTEQREKEKNQAKQKIMTQLASFESAVDQVEIRLKMLIIDTRYGFKNQGDNFQKWNRSIEKYLSALKALESVDEKLYEAKMEKVKQIELLFVAKLTDQVLTTIELIKRVIDPRIKILQANEAKKKTKMMILSDNTEFNKLSYEFFFGPVDKVLWKNLGSRRNFSWFYGNTQQSFQLYWQDGIEQYFDLLFQYYNKKQIIHEDTAGQLKAHMTGLQEEIQNYKQLLSNAYNGMLAVQKKLPSEDKTAQTALLEDPKNKNDNYENHLTLLNKAQSTITHDFLYKLWPEDAPQLI